jgi:hypothetical protein
MVSEAKFGSFILPKFIVFTPELPGADILATFDELGRRASCFAYMRGSHPRGISHFRCRLGSRPISNFVLINESSK